jgi:hypothetical protein
MHLALQRNMFFVGFFTRILRFTDYKRMTPFDMRIKTPDGATVVRVTRGV